MAEYTTITKTVEYIPEWEGNREAPAPIRATLRYLTAAQRSQCIGSRVIAGDTAITIDFDKALRFGLEKLSDFVVNKQKVETAEQLRELSGFDGLFTELAIRVWQMNAREDARPLS